MARSTSRPIYSKGTNVELSVIKGLKVRMDFNTHKKYAKLDDGVEDSANRGVVVSNPKDSEVREVTEEEKLAKVITDALLNK